MGHSKSDALRFPVSSKRWPAGTSPIMRIETSPDRVRQRGQSVCAFAQCPPLRVSIPNHGDHDGTSRSGF